jgi:hypothetical protein
MAMRGCGALSSNRKEIENALNEYKYDLMVLTQDLGKVVPSSELARELQAKSKAIQEKITRLEQLLLIPQEVQQNEDTSKKFVSPDGEVRIWSSAAGTKKSQS